MSTSIIYVKDLKGLGAPGLQKTPITDPISIGLLERGHTFTNAEACDELSNWLTDIASKDIMIIPNIRGSENQKVEDGVYQGDYGDKVHLWKGMQGKRLMALLNKYQDKLVQDYSDQLFDIVFFDRNNNILVKLNSDDTIGGFELSYFHVFDQEPPAADTPPFTPIEYQIADPGVISANGAVLQPTFRVKDVVPITHVQATCSTVDTNVFTLTAYYQDLYTFSGDFSADTEPLTGLTATDLKIIDENGSLLDSASDYTVTESTLTKGTYTVDATVGTLASGSCQVIASATSLYESPVITLTAA